jgi:hypothetical protein
MGKLGCQCGYAISDLEIEESVAHPVDTELLALLNRLREAGDLDHWALRMIPDNGNLFHCPNCGRLVWEKSIGGPAEFFVPAERPIIRADPARRDGQGNILLAGPEAEEDITRQKLILPGIRATAVWDGGQATGLIVCALDEHEERIEGAWALDEHRAPECSLDV